MKKYDAVIIGAGPAGGQCARELTQAGFSVLIIDKARNFLENNYSSGGAPIDIMAEFNLPESIVGTYWNTLRINSTKSRATWTSASAFGPILNFDQLREFLVREAVKNGGEFLHGYQYQNHQIYSHCVEVYLKELESGTIIPVQTSVVVDATGTDRKVLAQQQYDKHQAIVATGIEYHIKVSKEVYKKYSKALNFFLGHQWMPQGYAWIFPMNDLVLKVGVIRYFQNKNYIPYEPSYKCYLDRVLNQCGPYQIQDKHGKTIFYTEKHKDIRVKGPIIAVGDAISSVNPLGWEGIRHAMYSGRFAAQAIQKYLQKDAKDLSSYTLSLDKYFGRKWFFSEKFTHHLFRTSDAVIDRSITCFNTMNNEEIMKVIFQYQFRHTIKAYLWYFLSFLKEFFKTNANGNRK